MPPCASRNEFARGDDPRPARPSWTARASRPPNGGPHGYDGAKRLNGRKRYLLVDTLGLVIKVHMTAADVGDRDGAMALLRRLDRRRFPGCGMAGPTLATAGRFWTDAGEQGHHLPGGIAQRWRAKAALAPARRHTADRVPVRGGPAPVGGGADLRVARSVSAPQQGL